MLKHTSLEKVVKGRLVRAPGDSYQGLKEDIKGSWDLPSDGSQAVEA
ncbi:hypothetical protein GX441_00520 [bacterium]|nr:hypothetical protein [bacterium]